MPLFARFGRALNEMGGHVKTAPIVGDFRKAGVLGAATSLTADAATAEIGLAQAHLGMVMKANQGSRWAKAGLILSRPDVIGTAAGAGVGAVMNRRDRLRGAVTGSTIGGLGGYGYHLLRHGGGNMRTLRGLPGVFRKGFQAA